MVRKIIRMTIIRIEDVISHLTEIKNSFPENELLVMDYSIIKRISKDSIKLGLKMVVSKKWSKAKIKQAYQKKKQDEC